ncbi:MAG: Ldh family oxidoreductase [Candidatus Competibacterales bacterium]|nr:Ldh family oxidoreductase [Candidatus Competibacterales bacterium]
MAGVAEEPTPTLAVRLAATDNVATLLSPARAGTAVSVRETGSGDRLPDPVTATIDLAAGHKIALGAIPAGAAIVKYGLPIGRATADIAAGAHVHVHNTRSAMSPAALRTPGAVPRPHRVPVAAFRRVVQDCLEASAVPAAAARDMTDALTEAHLRGVETHGVRRLAPYLDRIRAGGVDPLAEPRIETQGPLLRVDGRAGIGHHVAGVAADHTAHAATESGLAAALVRNSSHFGFAGYYATRIAAWGMVALVVSNGQVLVGPEGARAALFSNNPFAIAAPLPDGTFFEFDMATSVTSRARLVQASERGDPIPEGLALDAAGHPTTDAAEAAAGILLPLAGAKGLPLIAALELLAGVLGGGPYADQVASKEDDPAAPEGTGHFLLAIDLDSALGSRAFAERLADLVHRIETLPMRPGAEPPRYPGARRWRLRAERMANGIPLTSAETDQIKTLSRRLGIESWA